MWVRDRDDHDNLRPWPEQFGLGIIERSKPSLGRHFGCGCRTLDQLRRWFTVDEYASLLFYGYAAVQLEVDAVLAESDIQLVFQRRQPLHIGASLVSLYVDSFIQD